MPKWIERDAGKVRGRAGAKERRDALHRVALERRAAVLAEERDIAARSAALAASRIRPASGRGIRPGERRLPCLPDAELREALRGAVDAPAMIGYPHLLILRERGYTVPVHVVPEGALASLFVGDRATEEGKKWLMA